MNDKTINNGKRSELETMLGLKASLCQSFAGKNLSLMQSLYEGDSLIYEVKYPSGRKDLIIDNTRNFPYNMEEYKTLSQLAYDTDGKKFIESTGWRS